MQFTEYSAAAFKVADVQGEMPGLLLLRNISRKCDAIPIQLTK